MTPAIILIQYDKCRINLNLPIFFEGCPFVNIRKVFKLMEDRPSENKETFQFLDHFFPLWLEKLEFDLEHCARELEEAKRDAENKRRVVASLGGTLKENIAQAKQWLAHAKRNEKNRPGAVAEHEKALKTVMRPQIDYKDAVKAIKRFSAELRKSKTALERGRKIINAYNQILR